MKALENKARPEWQILLGDIYKQRYLFLLMAPALITLFIFSYIPMYGVLLAFKEYVPDPGNLLGKGAWVGLDYIRQIFSFKGVGPVIRNTLMYSLLGIVFGFPAPIILAVLFSELYNMHFKKVVQSISYLPNFLSWVVVAGMVRTMLSPSLGIYGPIADLLGMEKIVLLTKEVPFIVTIVVSGLWKSVGWSSVVYMAVIAGIDTQLYEAASIDGVTRFKKIIYITLPGLVPIISLNFIMMAGSLLSSNFDQMYNLANPLVMGVADVLDTYIYRVGLEQFNYSFSTALTLVRTVISVALIAATNWFIKKHTEFAIW